VSGAAERGAPVGVRPGWEDIYERSLDCVHCGLCLPACPTYRETGREVSSPRGRIYLARGVAEGRIDPAGVVADEAYLCLGCRACETACPSGVRYGALIEAVRREIESEGLRGGLAHWVERFALREILPHRRRLALAFDLLWIAQRLGLDRLLLPLLPAEAREAHALLPRVPPRAERRRLPARVPAVGEPRGRVALLEGCVMPELFGRINAATARVLARNGFEVVVPADQGCCGALQAHAGDAQTARALARRNTLAFGAAGVDAVVVNSAGCGAALRDAAEWLPGEGEALASRARDVCELLHAEGLRPPAGRVDATVCYDDPCHLVHGQRVEAAPRALLAAIPGLKLVSHDDPGACCGAAGTYNLTHGEMSRAVLAHKIEALAAADPDVIATGNPGCLMQLSAGAARAGLRARVVHPVELLDEAYAAEG
jgi:glycolate oxidase iron-sulfur subunit